MAVSNEVVTSRDSITRGAEEQWQYHMKLSEAVAVSHEVFRSSGSITCGVKKQWQYHMRW